MFYICFCGQASVYSFNAREDTSRECILIYGVQGGSRISSDLYRLLLGEEEDDATSALAAAKPEPDAQKHDVAGFQEVTIFLVIILCM